MYRLKDSGEHTYMKICILTDRYPIENYPANTFLNQLVCQMAEQGVECTVIAPYRPLRDRLRGKKYHPPYVYRKTAKSGKEITIYNPHYFGVVGKTKLGIDLTSLHQKLYTNAIKRVIKKEKLQFDAVYGHFIMPAGFAAAEIGKIFNKPSFLAYGESSFANVGRFFSDVEIQRRLTDISGIVAVSGKNRDELLEHGVVSPEKIRVFPNAIDNDTFKALDKNAAREKLGISREDFVVAFVGHFINRKGSKRLSDALEKFDDVKSVFIGAGPEEPVCDNIVYKGKLPHDEIPMYLNAADVFVLPTLAEGCCNAIVEAMACGLPIISSNLPFNDDILDESNSIRIDPQNVDELTEAIRELRDNKEKRERMSKASLLLASSLTIDKRAERILSFIEETKNK